MKVDRHRRRRWLRSNRRPRRSADGSYPFSRSLYIYVNTAKAEENPAVASYVDLYLSERGSGEGQRGWLRRPAGRSDPGQRRRLGSDADTLIVCSVDRPPIPPGRSTGAPRSPEHPRTPNRHIARHTEREHRQCSPSRIFRAAPAAGIVNERCVSLFQLAAVTSMVISALILFVLFRGALQFLNSIDWDFGKLSDTGWFPRRERFDLRTIVVGSDRRRVGGDDRRRAVRDRHRDLSRRVRTATRPADRQADHRGARRYAVGGDRAASRSSSSPPTWLPRSSIPPRA